MAKRNKQRHSLTPPSGGHSSGMAAGQAAHSPAKNPTLLAVSLVVFAGWFVFLLVTALMS